MRYPSLAISVLRVCGILGLLWLAYRASELAGTPGISALSYAVHMFGSYLVCCTAAVLGYHTLLQEEKGVQS